jgi:hypothetical protein
VALGFLIAFGLLLVLLATQQAFEERAKAPDVLDYLLAGEGPADVGAAASAEGSADIGAQAGAAKGSEDPLGIASAGLRLVGVAQDGAVVGYVGEAELVEVMRGLDCAMRAQGWTALAADTPGILSYTRQEAAEGIPWTYVMFLCSERGRGISVVAELL